MDPTTPVIVALITALSGLISGLVVAYAKPLAEERALVQRERRENRKRQLQAMWDALIDPRNSQRSMPMIAAALGDEQLTLDVDRLLSADSEEEREAALTAARRRLGQLMRG